MASIYRSLRCRSSRTRGSWRSSKPPMGRPGRRRTARRQWTSRRCSRRSRT